MGMPKGNFTEKMSIVKRKFKPQRQKIKSLVAVNQAQKNR